MSYFSPKFIRSWTDRMFPRQISSQFPASQLQLSFLHRVHTRAGQLGCRRTAPCSPLASLNKVWMVTQRGSSRLASQPPVQIAAGSSLLGAEIKRFHKVSFSLSPGSTQCSLKFPPSPEGGCGGKKKNHKRIKPEGSDSPVQILPFWA